jgi:hypothetical protein
LEYNSDPQTHVLEIRGLTFGGYSEVATLRVTYDSSATSNNAPIFTSLDTFTIDEDAQFDLDVTATDSDGDNVIFSQVSNDCGGLVFNDGTPGDNTAELSWAAGDVGNDDVETCEIVVRADDGTTTVDQSISITVTNTDPGLNVSGTINDLTEDDPDTVILTDAEVDSDDEGLGGVYSIVDNGAATFCNDPATIGTVTISASTGETSFEPKADWFGSCEFSIEIDDGNGGVVVWPLLTINVLPGLDHFLVEFPASSVLAGDSMVLQVVARDSANNALTSMDAALDIILFDVNALLVATITPPSNTAPVLPTNQNLVFTNGVAELTVVIYKSGIAVDDGDLEISTDGSHSIVYSGSTSIEPAALGSFEISGVTDPLQINTTTSATVTAIDAYGNDKTDFTGTIEFSSSDLSATLPANYTFVGGDSGVRDFTNAITFATLGEQTLSVTDFPAAGVTSTLSNITVNPPPAPPAPTSVNLAAANKTPGTTGTPAIVVTGVDEADTVQIFSDSGCVTPKSAESAPEEAAGDGIIEVTTNILTSEIDFQLYAKTKRLGVWSDCSTDYAPYRYDNTAPTTSVQAQIISHSGTRTYYREDMIELLITFSEPVEISKSDAPYVTAVVTDGATNTETIEFSYQRMRSSNEAVFASKVSDTSLTTPSVTIVMNSTINAPIGTINDSAGNSAIANPTFTIPSLGTLSSITINEQKFCGEHLPVPGLTYVSITGAGNGVPDFDYLICNETQLRDLSANCRNGNSAACSYKFLLMDYIEFTTTPFPPIGSSLAPFLGSFNGNFRGISEVIVNGNNGDSVDSGAGFFGMLAGQANISNLFLGDMSVVIPDLASDTVAAGFLAGNAETISPNFIIIENVFIGNGSSISSYSPYLGGLVGYAARVNATTVLVESSITQNQTVNGYQTGGVFGYASDVTLWRSVYKGTLSGKTATGGLVGLATGASHFSENIVEATIDVTAGASVAGGLVGVLNNNQNVVIQDNAFFGIVNNSLANPRLGGLVGEIPSISALALVKNNLIVAKLTAFSGQRYAIVGDDIDTTNVGNAQFLGNFYSLEVSDGFPGEPNLNHATKSLGVGMAGATRFKQNHYTESKWNFRSVWGVAEGTEYPFPKYLWFPEHYSHTIFVTSASPTGGLKWPCWGRRTLQNRGTSRFIARKLEIPSRFRRSVFFRCKSIPYGWRHTACKRNRGRRRLPGVLVNLTYRPHR